MKNMNSSFAEYAADAMEELTEEQRILVKRAFDVVEIFDAEEAINNIEYDIKPRSTLRVYDKNQDYYSGYVLKIMGISGEEKILELVKYRRSHKQEEATGTEGVSVRPNRGYMRSLLLHSPDNDRVYIEKLQATIPSIDIRKKLAIRERLGGI